MPHPRPAAAAPADREGDVTGEKGSYIYESQSDERGRPILNIKYTRTLRRRAAASAEVIASRFSLFRFVPLTRFIYSLSRTTTAETVAAAGVGRLGRQMEPRTVATEGEGGEDYQDYIAVVTKCSAAVSVNESFVSPFIDLAPARSASGNGTRSLIPIPQSQIIRSKEEDGKSDTAARSTPFPFSRCRAAARTVRQDQRL